MIEVVCLCVMPNALELATATKHRQLSETDYVERCFLQLHSGFLERLILLLPARGILVQAQNTVHCKPLAQLEFSSKGRKLKTMEVVNWCHG